jgi:hypothetical protein
MTTGDRPAVRTGVGVGAAIVTAAGMVWAFFDTSNENLLPCLLGLCAIAFFHFLLNIDRKWKIAIASLMAVSLFAFALTLKVAPEKVTARSAAISSPKNPFADTSPITVVPPDQGKVERCAVMTGTASEVPGFVLWTAHVGADRNYFYHKASRESGNTWRVKDTVGGENDRTKSFKFFAFYLDYSLSRFLESIAGEGNDGSQGYMFSGQLPPNYGIVTQTLVRDNTPHALPCPSS